MSERLKFWHNIEGKSKEEEILHNSITTNEYGIQQQHLILESPSYHKIRRLRAYFHLYLEQPLLHAYEAMIESPHDNITMDVDRHLDYDESTSGSTWWHNSHETETPASGDSSATAAPIVNTRERLVLLGHHCDDIVHILSEVDLLLALIENETEWLEGVRYSTLKELGYAMISTSPLEIVPDTTTALDAFTIVLNKKKSIAVLDQEGKFRCALSCYDFLHVLTNNNEEVDLNFVNLLRPLHDLSFVTDVNQICHENDTLVSIIDTMLNCNQNRDIIMLTDDGIPFSMVSPTDIFELVVRLHEQSVYVYNDSTIMKEKRELREKGANEEQSPVTKKGNTMKKNTKKK